MEITINNRTCKIKYGFKAMMIYERIDEKVFDPKTIGDVITFFYCCLLATTPDIGFEEFIEWLDENPDSINEFNNYLANVIEATTLKTKKATEKENQ